MNRGRRQRRNQTIAGTVAVVAVLFLGWVFWPQGEKAEPTGPTEVTPPSAKLPGSPTVARLPDQPKPTEQPSREPIPAPPETRTPTLAADTKPTDPTPTPTQTPVEPPPTRPIEAAANTAEPDPGERIASTPEIAEVLRQYQSGEKIAARTTLNRLLAHETSPARQRELRRHLATMANETIFARAFESGETYCTRYTIASGDNLDSIARRHRVPAEVVVRLNEIADKNRIRAGQSLKLPIGPFNAVVYKGAHRLDLYLQDLYVKSFPVGLGADGRTPTGTWVVEERLVNPQFYPPASSEIRRVIPGGAPDNPLGKYWVGLEGIEGNAVGEAGFGIHGTIEPQSIGKDASLGCVRMLDDDIAFVFGSLLTRQSKVKTLP